MFLEGDQRDFFKPLALSQRELFVACLRSLYERLQGPMADHNHKLTKADLIDILVPIVQATPVRARGDADEVLPDLGMGDDVQIANNIRSALLKTGWLETFSDRVGLVIAYRFTRPGKLFAEALWHVDRPASRSRLRNMRSCRNALEAALSNADANDLLDSYHHAERVLSDLSEGVDYFQDLLRRLMSEIAGTPWSEFATFLDRFDKEFKKQLTADNAQRHRTSIRDTLTKLRALPDEMCLAIEDQLNDIAPWAQQEAVHSLTTFDWLLDRIEDMIDAACTIKQPELLSAMSGYTSRAASIIQQAMLMKGSTRQNAYIKLIHNIATLAGEAQDDYINRIGRHVGNVEVRLLDPASFKLRATPVRRKVKSITRAPYISREARKEAALRRAEAEAFAISNRDVIAYLTTELKLRNRPILLSSLPLKDALDVLRMMQAVEATRALRDKAIVATKLPQRIQNEYFSGNEYLIQFAHVNP